MVTGIGLVSPLGIGTDVNWRALTAGQSGIGRITHFDATAFASQIAGEVKNFDPLQWVEKKDVKKMDVFIQYAIAASQFAMDDAKLPITAETAPRVGAQVLDKRGIRSDFLFVHAKLLHDDAFDFLSNRHSLLLLRVHTAVHGHNLPRNIRCFV